MSETGGGLLIVRVVGLGDAFEAGGIACLVVAKVVGEAAVACGSFLRNLVFAVVSVTGSSAERCRPGDVGCHRGLVGIVGGLIMVGVGLFAILR